MTRFANLFNEHNHAQTSHICDIIADAERLEKRIELFVKDGCAKATSMTRLEECVMWAVKDVMD